MSGIKSPKKREQYYHSQMAALKNIDLPQRLGDLNLASPADGPASLVFFSRKYLVDNNSIEASDGRPTTMEHKSVLAHYIVNRAAGPLTGEYVPIERLTGLAALSSGPQSHLTKPLEDSFGNNYALFAEAAKKAGGRHEGKSQSGGEQWHFEPLPLMPMRVVFFEADEEFPAEIKVLFDSAATKVVAHECLELLQMALAAELALAAGLTDGCAGCGQHHDVKACCGNHDCGA